MHDPDFKQCKTIGKQNPYGLDFYSLLCLAVIVCVALVVRIFLAKHTAEDAYITFRYARNLLSGNGFVYNAGERVLGTTTPLFALMIAALGYVGIPLPIAAKAIGIAAECVSIVIIFLLSREVLPGLWALLPAVGLALSANNALWASSGMETGLYVLLILAAFFAYSRDSSVATGALVGLLVLTRPDGVLVGCLIGMHMLWRLFRDGDKSIIAFAVTAFVVSAPWLIFATHYYGSPIPNSVTAKAAAYRSSHLWSWVHVLANRLVLRAGGFGAVLTALFFIGSVECVRRRSRVALGTGWLFIYVFAFTLSRAATHGWYFAPILPLYILFGVIGVHALLQLGLRALSRKGRRAYDLVADRLAPAALVVTFLCVTGFGILSIRSRLAEVDRIRSSTWQPRKEIGEWLRKHAESDATVCLEPIGIIGWFSRRRILDEGGLVSPQVIPLNARIGGLNGPAIVREFEPDYYVAWSKWDMSLMKRHDNWEWFCSRYKRVASWQVGSQELILWRNASSTKESPAQLRAKKKRSKLRRD